MLKLWRSSYSYWLVGPRRPSDQSDANVILWLYTYLSICLSVCLSVCLCLVVGFRPRFHIVWSRPFCNCLVKKINQGTDVLTHNCVPPLLALCVLRHVCTRLITLTGGKNNHKIKIAVASWQSAVGFHPFHCKYTNILIALTARMGREGCVKRWVL